MSKYIVFRCKHCGKAGTSELRKDTLDKPALALKNKKLLCRYCMKHTPYKTGIVFDMHNLPRDAMEHAKKINEKH